MTGATGGPADGEHAADDVVLVHDRASIARVGVALDELHEVTATPITARRTWAQCWSDAHPEAPVSLVAVRRGGRLVGAALLTHRRRGLWDEVRPVGAGLSDEVHLPAVDAPAARALALGIRSLLDGRARPWRLVLPDLPPGDPVLDELLTVLPHSCSSDGDVSPRLTFGAQRDLRSYVSRNHHQQGRRLGNRLARDGRTVRIGVLRRPEEVAAVLPDVVDVCRARDHQVRGHSSLDVCEPLAFFRSVVTSHAARDEVRLTALWIDDVLAAYVLCFADGDTWRMWNCRFDPEYAAFGPGRLAHDASLEAALAEGAAVYDWMRGDEAYKDTLSDHVHQVVDLHAASHRVPWAVLEAARRGRAALRALKRRSPAVARRWDDYRRLRARMTGPAYQSSRQRAPEDERT